MTIRKSYYQIWFPCWQKQYWKIFYSFSASYLPANFLLWILCVAGACRHLFILIVTGDCEHWQFTNIYNLILIRNWDEHEQRACVGSTDAKVPIGDSHKRVMLVSCHIVETLLALLGFHNIHSWPFFYFGFGFWKWVQ